MHSRSNNQYSKESSNFKSDDLDLTLADLEGGSEESTDEIAEALDDGSSEPAASEIDSSRKSEPVGERSKNVSDDSRDRSELRSKNVSARQRRSPANDAKIIGKIRGFRVGDVSPACTSSVSYPTPLYTPSLSYPKADTPPTPANDNLIPVWSLTGDKVTAVCATIALQLEEKPAVAFTFNLTPDRSPTPKIYRRAS